MDSLQTTDRKEAGNPIVPVSSLLKLETKS